MLLLFSFFLLSSTIISVGGLPYDNSNIINTTPGKHNNGRNNNDNFNSSRRSKTNVILGGRGGQRSSTVTLRDEFPCEESALPSSSSAADAALNGGNNHDSGNHHPSSSTRVSFAGNSFAEMNNLQIDDNSSNNHASSTASSSTTLTSAAKSSLTTRGGGGGTDVMDDDEIDQMVENLIAGLDDNEQESEEESESEVEESEEEEEEDEEVEDEQIEASVDEEESDDETNEEEEQLEDSADGGVQQESTATEIDDTTVDNSSNSHPSKPTQTMSPPHPNSTNNNNRSRPPLPLATPTNAYYRFLVRRGPKGHILASLTLISVQWIHIYVPILYKSVASVLLKLHIYNPQVLWKRDRQRREEEDRRRRGIYPQKKGVMGVFSKKGTSQKKEQNAQQQRADLQASQTLKQLYKAIKSGEGSGGALSEVKYRYLSAAFRRRHGLGKEYRVEKPMSFLGETLEGDAHQRVLTEEAVVDEVVVSDGELFDAEVESTVDDSVGQSATKQKRKRKKINDWVVQAFGKPAGSGKQQHFESPLWKTVDNSAIMQAAWESRAAEQLAWQKKRRTKHGAEEENESEEETEESVGKSSGYGASKMFQSVMTRVGSNGRLPGAYPMDAPPIEECAKTRGVVDFARRYGYGDWSEYSEDEDDSFGGGDLFSSEPASQGRKARRRKKQRSIPLMDATDDTDTKRRKRRKKGSSSVKLGLSGGGVSLDSSNRVSFEFGASSSPRTSSRRPRDSPAMSSVSSSRRMELNDIKSKLSERSVLFTSDTRVNAPTELLNKSRDGLSKKKYADET